MPQVGHQPPPAVNADMLSDAIGQAAALVTMTSARRPRHPARVRPPGRPRIIPPAPAARHRPAAGRRAVANYIAKYATKSLTGPGLPSHGCGPV